VIIGQPRPGRQILRRNRHVHRRDFDLPHRYPGHSAKDRVCGSTRNGDGDKQHKQRTITAVHPTLLRTSGKQREFLSVIRGASG
jgi:hypothetical protein